MKNKILNIKNLSKSYGAFKVTDEITIDLHFDEIHALIGPNGAGKSTLIKQIVGSVKHDIGSIILDQEDITDLTDVERAKIGISRTFQVSSIIPQFSAIDNIVLSLLDKSSKTFHGCTKSLVVMSYLVFNNFLTSSCLFSGFEIE